MDTDMNDRLGPPESLEQQGSRPEFDLWTLVLGVWEHRWFLLVLLGLAAAATYVATGFVTREYTAQVSILPQNRSTSSSLLGQLATVTGAGIDPSATSETLYEEIIESSTILDALLARDWRFLDHAEPVSLFEILGFEPPEPGEDGIPRNEFFIKKNLRQKRIAFSRDRMTGYMVLRVTMPRDPRLAADVANYLAAALDDFNQKYRVSKAREQRVFVDARLHEVEADLQAAEAELTAFEQNNHGYETSPMLSQRFRELEREVSAQTSIWVELRRQLEMAKIEENKQTESVNILDQAEIPVRPSSPRRVLASGLAGFFALAFGILVVLVRVQLRWQRRAASGP